MNSPIPALQTYLVQTDLAWENAKANRLRWEWHLKQIPSNSLVVLPEMASTGFTMQPELHAEFADSDTMKWLKDKSDDKCICLSLSYKENNTHYNRFFAIYNGEVIAQYDKKHLFSYAKEDQHYGSGSETTLFEFQGWKIVPMVCFDLRFPAWIRKAFLGNSRDSRIQYSSNREVLEDPSIGKQNQIGFNPEAKHDAAIPEVLLVVANWPQSRMMAWDTLLKARSIENQCYTIAVNRVGVDGNGIKHSGHSQVVSYDGEYLLPPFERESLAHVTLEHSPLMNFRERFPFLAEADFNLF